MGGEGLLASYDAERRPIGLRNVKLTAEFYGEHEKFGDELAAIEDANAAGAEVRRRIGVKLVRGIGRMFHTAGQTMPAIDEFSLTTVPIDLYFNEQPLSKGTAFTWERDNNCR